VPALLDDLAEGSNEVLARLRQVWDAPETPGSRPRRMRAALALLPFEPALVRENLVGWMLEAADPVELIAVGDPEQSIYPYRGADVRAAVNLLRTIRRSPGRLAPWLVYAGAIAFFIGSRFLGPHRVHVRDVDRADYLIAFTLGFLLVTFAIGTSASGLFRTRAEAYFIIGSPVRAPAAAAYLLVRLGGTVGRLSAFISGAEREILPVINTVGGSVDRVNGQLDKVDRIMDSAVDAAGSVDTAVRP